MFNKIRALIRRKNITFKISKTCHALLIDDGYNPGIEKNIDDVDIGLLDSRRINLLYLILSFPWYGGVRDAYLSKLILSYKPTIVIHHHYINLPHSINRLRKITTICYQHSYIRSNEYLVIEHMKNIKCDYFCAFNDQQKNLIKNNNNTKFIITGSINGNYKIKSKINKSNYEIMFISEFRGSQIADNIVKGERSRVKVFQTLNDYASDKGLNITVGLNSTRPEKRHKISIQDERYFYEKYLPFATLTNTSSYELALQSKLIITFGSNLGLELLSAGYRVLFCLVEDNIDNEHDYQFIGKREGAHVVTEFKDLTKKIEYICNLSDHEWLEYLIKNIPWVMTFDDNNTKLHSLIKKCTP
jgi:surface carbohydrate biosynthesis protein